MLSLEENVHVTRFHEHDSCSVNLRSLCEMAKSDGY